MQEIKARLPSNFLKFWNEKKFIDFYLKTQNEEIPCHRLILCMKSKFFFREFSSARINSTTYTVPFNPNGYFINVITFLYSGELVVTIQNIAQYTAIGEYYEIDCLLQLVDKYFDELFTKDNAYELINNFCSNKIQRYHEKMTNILSKNFDDFKIGSIIKVADSKLLSCLLKELDNYTMDEKVKINDEFTRIHGRYLTDIDKENLTSIYDFSSNSDSYRFLIFNRCDWMVSSIQRILLSQVIDKRKAKIEEFQNNFDKSFEKVSDSDTDTDSTYFTGKWVVFSSISDISLIKETKEIDLIDYIRTFDGIIDKINPLQYGLINITHSEPISPLFGGLNIFDSFYYFASYADANNPYINFNIGWENRFLIHAIQLESVPNAKDKPKRPLIGKIIMSLANNEEEEEADEFYYNVEDPNVLHYFSENQHLVSSSSIRLTMIEANSSGGWLFRFSYPKIVGMFVFDFLKEKQ